MQNFADQLSSNPQAKQLLENQKAIRQMLANPETRKVLQSLQKKNVGRLQANNNFLTSRVLLCC